MSTLVSENWDAASLGGLPAGWVQSVAMAVQNTNFNSSPNGVWYPANTTPGTAFYTGFNDGNGGSAKASHVTWSTQTNIACNSYVLVRVTTTSPTLSLCIGYYTLVAFTGAVSIGYISGGALNSLASLSGLTLGTTDKYDVFCEASGSNIVARVQRVSDSKWMDSSGAWQSSQQDVHNITDTHITGAGYAGFALGRFNSSDKPWSDDFLWETTAGGVLRRRGFASMM